jgi:hypothetical protein
VWQYYPPPTFDPNSGDGIGPHQPIAAIEYPIWSTVHGLAVLTGQGPLRDVPAATRRRLEESTRAFIEWGLT